MLGCFARRELPRVTIAEVKRVTSQLYPENGFLVAMHHPEHHKSQSSDNLPDSSSSVITGALRRGCSLRAEHFTVSFSALDQEWVSVLSVAYYKKFL